MPGERTAGAMFVKSFSTASRVHTPSGDFGRGGAVGSPASRRTISMTGSRSRTYQSNTVRTHASAAGSVTSRIRGRPRRVSSPGIGSPAYPKLTVPNTSRLSSIPSWAARMFSTFIPTTNSSIDAYLLSIARHRLPSTVSTPLAANTARKPFSTTTSSTNCRVR